MDMPEIPAFHKKVPFVDTDMAGIVHFSKILAYAEEAEHAAMELLGVPVMNKSGGFPKVHVDCDYRIPLRFGDVLAVDLELTRVGDSSLTWQFEINVTSGLAAKGSMVTVYVSSEGKPCGIPATIRAELN